MSVGRKIKALRKRRGMTQGELAENIVSRGMLSRIENDTAEPSMNTLRLLSERLEVSPGFLLDTGDDLLPAERERFAKIIFDEFNSQNYSTCLELFSHTDFKSAPGFVGIYTYCAFFVAIDEFHKGNFSASQAFLDAAEEALSKSGLPIQSVSNANILLLRAIMDNISNVENVFSLVSTPDFSFQPSLFLFLVRLLQDGRHDDCRRFTEFCSLDDHYLEFISAQMLIKDYKFIDALFIMKSLVSKENVPFFLKLICYRSIENCCKLCEDYKGAYENHLNYSSLLEKIQ